MQSKHAAGIALLLIGKIAMAQTTADTMTGLAERIAIGKAQAQQLDLDVTAQTKRLELLKLQHEMNQLQGREQDNMLPWLKGVESLGGPLVATLVMADGQPIEAKVGTVLPNRMTVSAIRPGGVSLKLDAKRRVDLIVTAAPTSQPRADAARWASQGGLPAGQPDTAGTLSRKSTSKPGANAPASAVTTLGK